MRDTKLQNKMNFILGQYGIAMYWRQYYKDLQDKRNMGIYSRQAEQYQTQFVVMAEYGDYTRLQITQMLLDVRKKKEKQAMARAKCDLPMVRAKRSKIAKKKLAKQRLNTKIIMKFDDYIGKSVPISRMG
jgi:hypothetical protein